MPRVSSLWRSFWALATIVLLPHSSVAQTSSKLVAAKPDESYEFIVKRYAGNRVCGRRFKGGEIVHFKTPRRARRYRSSHARRLRPFLADQRLQTLLR